MSEDKLGIIVYPEDYIRIDQETKHQELLDEIEPWVQAVRNELTKLTGQDLPFKDCQEAFDWLEQTAYREMKEIGEPQIVISEGKEKLLLVQYYDRAFNVKRAPLARGSKLKLLAEQSEAMGDALQLKPPHLTAWVLADVRPPNIPIRIRSRMLQPKTPACGDYEGGQPIAHYINTIEVMSPEVTAQQVYDLYDRIHKEAGVDKKQFAKNKEVLLNNVVDDLGGVPKRHVKEFWGRVVVEYNSRLATLNSNIYKNPLSNWDAAKHRYERYRRKATIR